MMKMIFWCCDLLGVAGLVLFLLGIYFLYGMAILFVVGGLSLMGYATRLSWVLKRHDTG